MAERIITGTLRVSFTDPNADDQSGDGQIIIEVDDREDGLNEGRTQFYPGDPINILAYFPPGAFDIQTFTSIPGKLAAAGTGNRTVTDDNVVFSFSREGSLRYYTPSISHSWIGQSLGTPALQSDNRTVRIGSEDKLGIARFSYLAPYRAYRLSGVPLTIYDVDIGFKATLPE